MRKRETLQQTLRDTALSNSLPTVQAAQEKLCIWLQVHPDDEALWEAGEPLAMLADALQTQAADGNHPLL